MMTAFLLASGQLLHPCRAEGAGGLIGDGWGLAQPGSDAFKQWKPWTKPATAEHEELARRLEQQSRRP